MNVRRVCFNLHKNTNNTKWTSTACLCWTVGRWPSWKIKQSFKQLRFSFLEKWFEAKVELCLSQQNIYVTSRPVSALQFCITTWSRLTRHRIQLWRNLITKLTIGVLFIEKFSSPLMNSDSASFATGKLPASWILFPNHTRFDFAHIPIICRKAFCC